MSFHNTLSKYHSPHSVFGLQLLCKSKIPWPTRGFRTRFSKTFMKSQNTTHETIIHSPAGRVLWFHSLYFGISFMYLRPWSKIPLVDHGISYNIFAPDTAIKSFSIKRSCVSESVCPLPSVRPSVRYQCQKFYICFVKSS